jgi:acyl-CoA thioesterase-2
MQTRFSAQEPRFSGRTASSWRVPDGTANVDRAVSQVLDQLVKLLALERIEVNLFRGQSQDLGWGAVFGGQVLGQSLSAAVQTLPPERHVHSLHAYFLRAGDVKKPILYDVDRIRDGSSFNTRRVNAIQNGHAIFSMSASFHLEEAGFTHQDPMPEAPAPESLKSELELVKELPLPPAIKERISSPRPFELRFTPVDDNLFHPTLRPPRRMVWLRTVDKLPDDPALHRYLLAYASDHGLVTTALMPHGVTWMTPGMHIASLDHAMWFLRPFRVDEWLLHAIESPAAHGARGLVRGSIYNRQGELVACTAQEGLIRKR